MDPKRWYMYLPPVGGDGMGTVVSMPQNADGMQGVLDRLEQAGQWLEANRAVLSTAPSAFAGDEGAPCMTLNPQGAFPSAAACAIGVEDMLEASKEDGFPVIESTGKPFDPLHAQAVTDAEVFGALELADEGEFWDAWPANGCVQHLYPGAGTGGCAFRVDVPMSDEPEFFFSGGAPLEDVREALALALQDMREEEAETSSPRP